MKKRNKNKKHVYTKHHTTLDCAIKCRIYNIIQPGQKRVE